MTKINGALHRLKLKREQINTNIQKAEAQERKKQRQQDLKRKILIGAYYLEQAGTYVQIIEQMNLFLTRPSDRKLFSLEEQGSSKTLSSPNPGT